MAGRTLSRILLLLSLLACSISASHHIKHPHLRARDVQRFRAEHLSKKAANAGIAPIQGPDTQNKNRFRRGPAPVNALKVRNEALKKEYEDKLLLRDAIAESLSQFHPKLQPRQPTQYDAVDLEQENNALQDGLEELNAAFDSLFQIIADNDPVCIATSGTSAGTGTGTVTQVVTHYTTDPVLVTTSPSVTASVSATIAGTYTSADPTYATSSLATGRFSNSTQSNSTTGTTTSTNTTSGITTSTNTTSNSTSYTFDPMASTNVAVYYGQANITGEVRLDTICKDPSVDIVVLAFITDIDSGNGYPTLNLGDAGCYAATTAQTAAGATGLIDCTEVVTPQIETCQSIGKPVMLSFGGAEGYSQTTIPNATAAVEYADTLWKLFGQGTGLESIRPFGNVSLDGFDIGKTVPHFK